MRDEIPEEIMAKLLERRLAAGGAMAEWDEAERWLRRSWVAIKPGGALSVVLPDGRPFAVSKPRPERDNPEWP